jgi:hypothetical protein
VEYSKGRPLWYILKIHEKEKLLHGKERKKERKGKVNVCVQAANNDLVYNNGKKAVKSIQL